MKKMLIALLLCIAAKSFAALPPLAENIRELQAIMADEQFANKLGLADPLVLIKRIDNGYLFLTSKQKMIVEVIYKPNRVMGPAQFDLNFHKPKTLDKNKDSGLEAPEKINYAMADK